MALSLRERYSTRLVMALILRENGDKTRLVMNLNLRENGDKTRLVMNLTLRRTRIRRASLSLYLRREVLYAPHALPLRREVLYAPHASLPTLGGVYPPICLPSYLP